MHRVHATFQDGRVELSENVDWPNGTKVEVTPIIAPTVPNTIGPVLTRWPDGFFANLREQWGTEPFQRPPQGEFDAREEW